MLRKITLGGKAFTLEVASVQNTGDVVFRIEGEQASASVVEVMPRVYSIILEGRSYEARVISDEGDVVVEINGERYPVTVEDPRRQRQRAGAVHGDARATITAPMPGKVVRLLVSEGDEVTAGQGLIVIEAMKMQNEMKAPRSGRLASLPVHEGDTVVAGAVLAIVE